jgi:Predicted transcriptional regulator
VGKFRQSNSDPHPISLRLKDVRISTYGDRGRSGFARDLDIPVTSYLHYETDRLPPADLLVKVAELTGTNLIWLLTGEGPRSMPDSERDHKQVLKVVADFEALLTDHPHLIPSAEEFVQLLARMSQTERPVPQTVTESHRLDSLIPVIGSTAAGVARFWNELKVDIGGEEIDSRLEEILQQHTQREQTWKAEEISPSSDGGSHPIALVQLSRPDERGFLEFLSAEKIKAKYPGAVAWRIDGDSMFPRYRDGDFVITCPTEPAVELHPCVARQRGQIGVNCKLFQCNGDEISLIPVNESCPIQRFHRSQLMWAWRVLASVRLR